MCRFSVYKGRSILIGDLIVYPDNSLLTQSRDARYHPGIIDDSKHRRNILVNGDGFGLSWYGSNPDKGSCVFKFTTPAWSDLNLRNIGEHVQSSLIMAHIRAASSGHEPFEDSVVSVENCHPFKHGRYTFMHNGSLPQFKKLKRSLHALLRDDIFTGITGTTDSEHIFALLLNNLPDVASEAIPIQQLITAVEDTMALLLQLCVDAEITEPCSLNIVVSDGINIIATRFRSGVEEPPSLYYLWGSEFACTKGRFVGKKGAHPKEIVISSAPLSRDMSSSDDLNSYDGVGEWVLMPKDHMLVVVGDQKGKDVSIVEDVYLLPLELKDFDYQSHRKSLSRFRSPSSPMLSVQQSSTSESDSSFHCPSSANSSKTACNRLRVVGSQHYCEVSSSSKFGAAPHKSRHNYNVSSLLLPDAKARARLLSLVFVPLLFFSLSSLQLSSTYWKT